MEIETFLKKCVVKTTTYNYRFTLGSVSELLNIPIEECIYVARKAGFEPKPGGNTRTGDHVCKMDPLFNKARWPEFEEMLQKEMVV